MTKDKKQAPPIKHIPQRTCIACRKTGGKRELVRLVRVAGGEVEADPTGKKAGRGAYLCGTPGCWESALKTGRLEQALRTSITQENKVKLVNYVKGLDNTSS
jgi:predicted RNA-binding protein YlxR (DUF448 family)